MFYALNLFLPVKIANQSAPAKSDRNFVFGNKKKENMRNIITEKLLSEFCNLNLKQGTMFFEFFRLLEINFGNNVASGIILFVVVHLYKSLVLNRGFL